MIETMQDFADTLPPLLQWVAVMIAGMIPFIESYTGSVIGVLAGMSPPVAVLAAVVGNVLSMSALVVGASAVRGRARRGDDREPSAKRQRLRKAFDRYGVAGVSLIGQSILPSQITSAAMVSFGASRNAVLFWQTVSIILWGVGFGLLATLGVDLLA